MDRFQEVKYPYGYLCIYILNHFHTPFLPIHIGTETGDQTGMVTQLTES